LALIFGTTLVASAQQTGNNANQGGQANEQTIRGIVTGVTVLGETMVNYQTRRAEAAQATYITVLGSPDWGRMSRDPSDKDRTGDDKDKSGATHSSSTKRRANVYVQAVGPGTAFREASGSGRDAAKSASTTQFDRLEVGEWVEVDFRSMDNTNPANRPGADTRHGWHRTFIGQAVSVTILPEPQHGEQANESSSSRSETSSKLERKK
jgi:hypothetical protein